MEASIIIVAYNSASVLPACLESIALNNDLVAEIIIVDNASPDNSRQTAIQVMPSVRTLHLKKNEGFGAGCNAGAKIAQGRYLVFLNPDTIVVANWLGSLIQPLEEDKTIGATTSKIILMDVPSRINACGNDVHFTGYPSCHLLGVEADSVHEMSEVTSVSGAAFAIERKLFMKMKGFDPGYFMYVEDNDLSWRLWLMGLRCVYVPQSVVRHHYANSLPSTKYLYLERNRYQLLAKNLRRRTMLALIPALTLAEISSWIYSLLCGPQYVAAKLHALSEVIASWGAWRESQRVRALLSNESDRTLLRVCPAHLPYKSISKGWVAHMAAITLNPIYGVFHRLAILLAD